MFGHSCIYLQVPALSPAEANTRLLHSIFHHSELLHVFGAQILGTAAYIWTLLHISAGTSFISCRAKHGTTAFNISPQYTWALLLMFGYCCLYLDTAAYIWILLLIFGHCYLCLGTVAYIWALLLIIGHWTEYICRCQPYLLQSQTLDSWPLCIKYCTIQYYTCTVCRGLHLNQMCNIPIHSLSWHHLLLCQTHCRRHQPYLLQRQPPDSFNTALHCAIPVSICICALLDISVIVHCCLFLYFCTVGYICGWFCIVFVHCCISL